MPVVHVLIITALQSEFQAAREAGAAGYANHPGISSWEEQGHETPVPFIRGEYVLANGNHISIALARPTRMGANATSPVVSSLVERLRPSCLAMCGVCAGNPAVVALGDVVVAEMAYAYDEGKRTAEAFVGDHRQIPLSESWVRIAQDLSTTDLPSYGGVSGEDAKTWLLERLYAGDDPRTHPSRPRYIAGSKWAELVRELQAEGLIRREGRSLSLTDEGFSSIEDVVFDDEARPTKLPFAVIVGPMASGNVVVQDGLAWAQLAQRGVRNVVGLEMEAATIAQVAYRLEVPEWVIAKGVMDHADPHKSDRYGQFAARASAEVLFKLLALRFSSTALAGNALLHRTRIKSVYMIGGVTGETRYPDFEQAELANFCQRLGMTIARAGAELIVCSPFPDSADFHALMGYIESGDGRAVHLHSPRFDRVRSKEDELRAMLGAEKAQIIKNWYYPGPETDEADSLGQAWLLCQLMALDQSDVVIAVGGRPSRTASTILHLAEARQIPVVPFEFLGGASRNAFNRRNWAGNYPGLDFLKLKDKDAVVDAMEIADHMITARMRGARSYTWPPRGIFISRARADSEFASALSSFLSTAGLHMLLERDFPTNRTIESAIEDAVLQSDLFIVLWSRSYAASRFCFDEIELALQRHQAGELQLWIVNIDGSDVVPRAARALPQIVARTPHALIAVVKDLLQPHLD